MSDENPGKLAGWDALWRIWKDDADLPSRSSDEENSHASNRPSSTPSPQRTANSEMSEYSPVSTRDSSPENVRDVSPAGEPIQRSSRARDASPAGEPIHSTSRSRDPNQARGAVQRPSRARDIKPAGKRVHNSSRVRDLSQAGQPVHSSSRARDVKPVTEPGPSTSRARDVNPTNGPGPSTSRARNTTPAGEPGPSTSRARNTTPAGEPGPSTSRARNTTPAGEPGPSTSRARNICPAGEHGRSTSRARNICPAGQPGPSTSRARNMTPAGEPGPSTSRARNMTPAGEPRPSTSRARNITPAGEPGPSTSRGRDRITVRDRGRSPARNRDRNSARDHDHSPPRDRDRSRSPLIYQDDIPSPSGVVVRIYNEPGVALDDVEDQDMYMAAEGRVVFGDPENFIPENADEIDRIIEEGRVPVDPNDSDSSSCSGRHPGRCRRCGGRQPERRRRWQVGDPLQEKWPSDEDVPRQLREMAEAANRRPIRVEEDQARNRDADSDSESESDTDDDVYQDATEHVLMSNINTRFDWFPMDTFHAEEETFTVNRTGSVRTYSSPYAAFRSYWDDNILQVIVNATNKHAQKIQSPTFQDRWYPTNIHEILCLFAFWVMFGIIKLPSINSCFSTNPLLKTDVFQRIFNKRRYTSLIRALNFVDDTLVTPGCDRIRRLRPIVQHLNAQFQANYVLSKDVCIDESLSLWKGRMDIKRYILGKQKAAEIGIKTFELCESSTGYLWSFLIFTGKRNGLNEIGISCHGLNSTRIVHRLMAPLFNKGHRLFMDNWFNSPLLARFLKCNGTDCVGALRTTRPSVPVIVARTPLNRGQFIARHSGDVCVLAWQDKTRVSMISTCHGSDGALPTVASRRPRSPVPFKPKIVLDYEASKGGVDLKDQLLEPYLHERKRCASWYMKVFKRFLNCSIQNARILLQSSRCHRVDNLTFRLDLVSAILRRHESHCEITPRSVHVSHWPVRMQGRLPDGTIRRKRLKCVVCHANNIETKTSVKCEGCNVPLCVSKCFKKYHTR